MSDWPLAPAPVSMGELRHPSAPQAYGAPYVVRSPGRGAHEATPQSAERLHYSPTSPRTEQGRGQHAFDAATSATTSGTSPNADPRLRHATRVDTHGSASSNTAKRSATPHAGYAPGESRAHGREPEARRSASPLSAAHARERAHALTAQAGSDHEAPRVARTRTRSSGPAPKEKKKSPVVCTNNKHDPRLVANGGTQDLGTRSQCIRRGFGSGLYSKPENVEDFLRKHSVPYSKIIEQKLWYKDSTDQMPAGYQVATLPQAFQRGFGAGQAKLARQLLQERRAKRRGVRA